MQHRLVQWMERAAAAPPGSGVRPFALAAALPAPCALAGVALACLALFLLVPLVSVIVQALA
jgi:hypothetical protein